MVLITQHVGDCRSRKIMEIKESLQAGRRLMHFLFFFVHGAVKTRKGARKVNVMLPFSLFPVVWLPVMREMDRVPDV
jgi:hypothetical protein